MVTSWLYCIDLDDGNRIVSYRQLQSGKFRYVQYIHVAKYHFSLNAASVYDI